MFLERFWRRETPAHSQISSTPTQSNAICLHQLIERQAAQTPSNIAVEFEGNGLTYRELNERANQLAHFLKNRHVRPETVIGLGTKRTNDLLVGLLGIWKAGAAYVPFDYFWPPERLRYTAQDSQAVMVLTEESLRNVWEGLGPELLFLDSDWNEIARESKENPKCLTRSDNLAQLLYTSGSTGRPKGVEIPHRNLMNFFDWLKVEPGMTANDVVLASTNIAFDMSGVELFMPLAVGARVVMLGRDAGTRSFIDHIERYGLTFIQGTPTMLRWFLEFGWPGKKDLKIISGGEALSRELANKLAPLCGELWNIYGPTETTIWSTLTRVESATGPVSIGHPICNTQICLLDDSLKPVADGDEGEICIGGVGVARGYHNKPDETAKRFVTHPDGKDAGMLYRTGDLARTMANGELEYLGRLDHQIKINGERIEPQEIEAAMMRFPGVRQALVIAREDVPGEKRLVGYAVMQEGIALNAAELRRFLVGELPKTLVPPNFVALPQFPVSNSGKIDRTALPRPVLPAGKTAL